MKISLAVLLAAVLPSSAAFSPVSPPVFRSSLSAVKIVTGPKGKPASSFEEDLLLTLKIIEDHDARSVTVSKDQLISQMKDAASTSKDVKIDVSIPYDAAARLAYESSNKSVPYAEFKKKYESDAVADVKAKRAPFFVTVPAVSKAVQVDLSIPYDAAAKLAYEKSDKSVAYPLFKESYEANAVAEVIAKRQPKVVAPPTVVHTDLSIPYDAAAKLAYEKSDKSMAYPQFKENYEANAVAEVIAKRQPKVVAPPTVVHTDLSIPYDAAAKLAYEKSDKSMAYPQFKENYEANAVAEVKAKRQPKVEEPAKAKKVAAPKAVDLSIPYDAAAKLAYESSDKSMTYAKFKKDYEAKAVAEVKAKRQQKLAE